MKIQRFKLLLLVLPFLALACKSNKNIANREQLETDEEIASTGKQFESESLVNIKEAQIEGYKGSKTRAFDLLHTSLSLSFDFDHQHVLGEANLTMKPYFFDQNQIILDAKDFDIYALRLGQEQRDELNYMYDGKKLTVFLPKTYSRNDTLQLYIKYTAMPNENPEKGSKAITDTKGLYFINPEGNDDKPIQIWTQGETEHNSKWFPTFDTPNERTTQDIKITIPSKYRTISNGKLISTIDQPNNMRTDHWEMDLPHAPYLAAVVIGEFVEIKDSWEDIQVNYYVEEKFAEGAKTVFKNTPEMIGFFSELLGVRYPWQKYDQVVVRDFVSGAMENTTISVFMEALNLNEREALDSEWDGIIAHELFHQWFGNYVTTESWANLTLNEAFANYSEYLWYDYKEGRDVADLHHISEMEQYFDESREKQVDLIRFYHEDSEDMFDSHSYAKGGRILHMLRRHLGDDAFFTSLSYYLTKHAWSSVEIHDLRLAFEHITGQDLNWFFNQWFLDSGHPVLSYQVDYTQKENLLLTITQNQDLTTTPLYKIPFKVSWYLDGERFEKEFILDKAYQQFAIQNKAHVNQLYFDEQSELLAVKKSIRGLDHFVKQYNQSRYGVARYEALDSLISNYSDEPITMSTVGLALKDPFGAIQEMAMFAIARNPEWIMQIKGLEEVLYDLAENGSGHAVQTGAIELLAILDPDKYSPSLLRWMNHPSYLVASAALSAYLSHEENSNRMAIAKRYMDEDNVRIIVAIADFLISEESYDNSEWFHGKLEKLSGQSLYYFLGYYGDYFSKLQQESESKRAVDNLYKIGLNQQANYIRAVAFQSMFGFVDDEGVLDKIKELYQKEEDEKLKMYMNYYLEPYLNEN
ncbi:M1 family metallopeptidase [Belliella kenyensis]|uniref:Aminopeptidase N n=1 Tax=Belliella kenyensis TaxID=1472724 RepID=A0ABV8EGH1_9BACT|nr:M1 family metallopeptidase [Belliella kenyensis]MCH7402386.1 M1 family metallopeptidase [Belliella kenyensis]MDN3603578.1 M1 family metallopeptidase [Belliella kenyensis]